LISIEEGGNLRTEYAVCVYYNELELKYKKIKLRFSSGHFPYGFTPKVHALKKV
jgi:hypothetical protein